MAKPDLGALIAQTMAPPAEERDIETITGEILDAQRKGGEAVLTIGRCLIEAKKLLPHGAWLPWLNEKVSYSDRTARRFMQMYRDLSNRPALTDLGKTKAFALLALPEKERDEFMAENNVADMTTRQLELAIKERDEARAAAEHAAADQRAAEQARDKMAADMRLLNARLAGAREEREQAIQDITRLEAELAEVRARPVEVAVETVVDQKAIDKARADAIAEMHAKLDKAKEAQKKAEEKQKAVEENLAAVQRQLNEAQQAERRAVIAGDRDLAMFELLFSQGNEAVNKLHGLLLKVRGRGDTELAEKLQKALLALADVTRRCAE